ncbi:MAG: MopE-related protein, partial [Myxococcota bacterium]
EGVLITYYVDSDSDGYGSDTIKTDACSAPSGYVDVGGDCIDTNSAVNPAATEVCNMGIDDDCDGSADDTDSSLDLSTRTTWYLDSDGDDFGDPDTSRTTCAMPTGHVADDTDCDDIDGDINPDAEEIWYDGVDQDCDGESDYDQDGDGYDSIDYSGTDENDTDPFCRRDCAPDGLTQSDAGASCKDILADYSSSSDGTYWIDPNDDGDTTDAFQVVCDMTNGGWAQCLEFENTSAEDLKNNTWFDDCVEYTTDSWTGSEVRIVLENASGTVLYDEDGSRPSGWTKAQLTSTAAVGSQYLSNNHSRLVTLSNTDKLFISGNTASNSGFGGSFGNGYVIVVYPATPNYYSNPKMIVASYRQYVGFTGLRQFRGWSTSTEIAGTGNTSFNTSSTTPAQLGTVTFWVR